MVNDFYLTRCVFSIHSSRLGNGKHKTHGIKNHLQSQVMRSYIYIFFYILTLFLFHFIMQTLLHPNGRSYRIIFVIRILEQDESTWVLSFKFYCNYIAFHDYSDWMASYEYNHQIDVLSNKINTYWLLAWYLAKNKAVSI